MANNLRVFNTNSEYQSADLVHPAVSYVIETDKVIYEPTPPTPSFKWKATYSNGKVTSAECGSSSEIVRGEINTPELVSVEIGDCVTSIGMETFYICYSLTSIDIPNSVTSIGEGAFHSCVNLTSIAIPSGVTSIGDSVFEGCSNLVDLNIPTSVTSIGVFAFSDCSSLSSVDLPSGVTTIGGYAFGNCKGLTSITVNATTPPTLGNTGVFLNTRNCPIYVPSASVNAYKSASGWSSYASRIQAIP